MILFDVMVNPVHFVENRVGKQGERRLPLSYHPESILVVSLDCITLVFVKDYRKTHEVFQYVACDGVGTTTRRGILSLLYSRVHCPSRPATMCRVVRLLRARDIILRIPTTSVESSNCMLCMLRVH